MSSHRKLRRALTRLFLLAPVSAGVGCNLSSTAGCEERTFEQTFRIADLRMPDGSTPTANHSCGELCMTLMDATGTCAFVPPVGASAPEEVRCEMGFICEGRRPEGLCSDGAVSGQVPILGALFAKMAHLEAASVPAFERLAEELAAHGAPARLVRAARRAAREEVRHARSMAELAERHGAEMPEVTVAPFRARSLEALALENAVEGCVRETFGALLAGWQARGAEDAAVREALATIAPDEQRHAALSWDIDAWAQGRLSPDARARIQAARRAAWEALERDAARSSLPADVARRAGLPAPELARRLVLELASELSPEAIQA